MAWAGSIFEPRRKISECAGVRKRWKCAVVDGVLFTPATKIRAIVLGSTLTNYTTCKRLVLIECQSHAGAAIVAATASGFLGNLEGSAAVLFCLS